MNNFNEIIHNYQSEFHIKNSELKEYKKEIEFLNSNKMVDDYNNLKKEIENLNIIITKNNNHINELNTKIEENNINYIQKFDSSIIEIESWTKRYNELENFSNGQVMERDQKIILLIKEIERINIILAQKNDINNDQLKFVYEKNITELSNALENKMNENKELKEKINEYSNSTLKENKILKSSNKEMEKKFREIFNENEEIKKKIKNSENFYLELESENNILKAKYSKIYNKKKKFNSYVNLLRI